MRSAVCDPAHSTQHKRAKAKAQKSAKARTHHEHDLPLQLRGLHEAELWQVVDLERDLQACETGWSML